MVGGFDDEGVERLGTAHLDDERVGDFARREAADADAVAQLRDAEIGHICRIGCHSTTFGTVKKPCSPCGAFWRTASRCWPSVTTSSRRRSVLGITALVGSTFAVS